MALYGLIESRTVRTRYGVLQGYSSEFSQVFLGIPYAKPPQRWKDAVKIDRWNGVLNATTVKPTCYQAFGCTNEAICVQVSEKSEDCLYLNVFAPLKTTSNHRKPVMVWIHGGAFVHGSGLGDLYNGEKFVQIGDVVLVTINYRLGALGFLVTGKTDDSVKGNYGIRDQQLALRWVKENIRAFGGDPEKITLFGHSAGGWSVITHLMLKNSKNLFHQAIIQSAPLGIPFKTYLEALQQGKEVSARLSCYHDDMACLRSKSADDIIVSQVNPNPTIEKFTNSIVPWVPYIDGEDITMKALSAAQNGLLSNKPMIIGITQDEAVFTAYNSFRIPLPSWIFELLIQGWKGNGTEGKSIISKYTPRNISDARPESSNYGTEGFFVCPTLKFANIVAGWGKKYVYVFNQTLPIKDETPRTPSCATNSCHSAEVPYVFNSFDKIGMSPTSRERDFAYKMVKYWTNFATSGSPNGHALSEWPLFRCNTDKYPVLVLQSENIRVVSNYRDNICKFWDNIGYE